MKQKSPPFDELLFFQTMRFLRTLSVFPDCQVATAHSELL